MKTILFVLQVEKAPPYVMVHRASGLTVGKVTQCMFFYPVFAHINPFYFLCGLGF